MCTARKKQTQYNNAKTSRCMLVVAHKIIKLLLRSARVVQDATLGFDGTSLLLVLPMHGFGAPHVTKRRSTCTVE
jgi:hypothetical protein